MDTIYIERAVKDHPQTVRIVQRYPDARKILIDRYTAVFNVNTQNFRLQKQNPALILAEKHDTKVLTAPPDYNIGGKHNYYFSHMMNCIYDCRYCFLQGMYNSANYVVFVNYQDFFDAITETTNRHTESSWYFSGYDCDSLALEPVTLFMDACLNYFSTHAKAHLEIRTKSTQIRSLLKRDPIDNCVIAYSLTPDPIARAVEHKTPSVQKRIEALKSLSEAGWKIGLRFDPLLNAEAFKTTYQTLFDTVFDQLDTDTIHSVSTGPFRLPKPFFKKLVKLYPEEPLLADKFTQQGSLISYPVDDENDQMAWCEEQLLQHIDRDRFFPCV